MPSLPTPTLPSFTIMADRGVSEGGSVLSRTASVVFKVRWSDRLQFVNTVCGVIGGFGVGGIVRTIPYSYPPDPTLYAVPEHSIEPHGKLRTTGGGPGSGGWVDYPYALVTINFAVPSFTFDGSDPSGQPWTTTTFDVSGEIVTSPASTFKFQGTGTPTTQPPGIVIPQVAVEMKRHWVPYLPVSEMLSLVGKVNDAPVPIGNFVAPEETLLFLGGPTERQADTASNVAQQVAYRFVYRPYPWNYALHPNGTAGWARIVDGNGDGPYRLGDFSTLP